MQLDHTLTEQLSTGCQALSDRLESMSQDFDISMILSGVAKAAAPAAISGPRVAAAMQRETISQAAAAEKAIAETARLKKEEKERTAVEAAEARATKRAEAEAAALAAVRLEAAQEASEHAAREQADAKAGAGAGAAHLAMDKEEKEAAAAMEVEERDRLAKLQQQQQKHRREDEEREMSMAASRAEAEVEATVAAAAAQEAVGREAQARTPGEKASAGPLAAESQSEPGLAPSLSLRDGAEAAPVARPAQNPRLGLCRVLLTSKVKSMGHAIAAERAACSPRQEERER